MDRGSLMSFAESIKLDLVGVAPVERFDELPSEKHPRSIFPEVESVVVVGRRITRGTLRGVEEGTNFHGYRMYGYQWLNDRFLAVATFQVASFLEDNGYEAVPLPPLPNEIPAMGIPVRPGAPAPNVLLDTLWHLHAPQVPGAHDEHVRVLLDGLQDVLHGQRVPFAPPPGALHAIRVDDEVAGVRRAVHADAAEPVGVDHCFIFARGRRAVKEENARGRATRALRAAGACRGPPSRLRPSGALPQELEPGGTDSLDRSRCAV